MELAHRRAEVTPTMAVMIVMIVVIAFAVIFVASFVYERVRRRRLRRLAESGHANAENLANPTGGLEKNLASEVLLRYDGPA